MTAAERREMVLAFYILIAEAERRWDVAVADLTRAGDAAREAREKLDELIALAELTAPRLAAEADLEEEAA